MLLIMNSGEAGKNFSSGWSQTIGAHFRASCWASSLTSQTTNGAQNVAQSEAKKTKLFILGNFEGLSNSEEDCFF